MITDWNKYIQYLKNWAEEHSDQVYDGSSPSCYDEWNDNENTEYEED